MQRRLCFGRFGADKRRIGADLRVKYVIGRDRLHRNRLSSRAYADHYRLTSTATAIVIVGVIVFFIVIWQFDMRLFPLVVCCVAIWEKKDTS